LVAVDDTVWSYYAFHYALKYMRPDDTLMLINVPDQPSKTLAAFSPALLVNDMENVSELRSRKILVYFGNLAKLEKVKNWSLIKADGSPGPILCEVASSMMVDQLVVGRRDLGTFKRMFAGSTSKYCIEYAECCVVVVKKCGPPLKEIALKGDQIVDIASVDHESLAIRTWPHLGDKLAETQSKGDKE